MKIIEYGAGMATTLQPDVSGDYITFTTSPLALKTFVWCGNTICEERESTGSTTTKRYFAEGEQRLGGKDEGLYYYTRDHLGSVREVTDGNGSLVAQMDYDPWGNESVVAGNMSFDFGFTGHYFHQPSGLNFTRNRVYSPTFARWISRDPLGNAEMSQGPNLYAYVKNDPISNFDLLGLYDYSPAETQVLINHAVHSITLFPDDSTRFEMLIQLHGSGGVYDFLLKKPHDTFCVDGEQINADDFGNYLAGYDSQAALGPSGAIDVRLAALFYATANIFGGRGVNYDQTWVGKGISDAQAQYGWWGKH